jgi:hypothetical protein
MENNSEFFNRTTFYRYQTINEAYIRYPYDGWHIHNGQKSGPMKEKLVYVPKEVLNSNKKITQEFLDELDETTRNWIQEGGRLMSISNKGLDEFYMSKIVTSIETITPKYP